MKYRKRVQERIPEVVRLRTTTTKSLQQISREVHLGKATVHKIVTDAGAKKGSSLQDCSPSDYQPLTASDYLEYLEPKPTVVDTFKNLFRRFWRRF